MKQFHQFSFCVCLWACAVLKSPEIYCGVKKNGKMMNQETLQRMTGEIDFWIVEISIDVLAFLTLNGLVVDYETVFDFASSAYNHLDSIGVRLDNSLSLFHDDHRDVSFLYYHDNLGILWDSYDLYCEIESRI